MGGLETSHVVAREESPMRIILVLLLMVAGWLFMMENDQEHVDIIVPGSGRIGPFSVGVIVIGSVLTGIALSIFGGILIRIGASFKRKKISQGMDSSHSDSPDASH